MKKFNLIILILILSIIQIDSQHLRHINKKYYKHQNNKYGNFMQNLPHPQNHGNQGVLGSLELTPSDIRIPPCSDISFFSYEENGVQDFDVFVLAGNFVIVGARNFLLRLRLSDLEIIEKVPLPSDGITVETCLAKSQKKEDCENFFRYLILENQKNGKRNGQEVERKGKEEKNFVFSCSTNAFAPLCFWRKTSNLSEEIEKISGIGKCPFSPHQNSTLVLSSLGDLYSATVMDLGERDYAIYRMLGPSKHLRTARFNNKWLNEPSFVSSFELGPFVYFFFREPAVDFSNCGKIIYSRVARVCQFDKGGKFILGDNWTSFLKARINCSFPAEYPVYFDQIQAVLLHQDLIFALFHTPPEGVHVSALCVYELSSLDKVFQGNFKSQQEGSPLWVSTPNIFNFRCGESNLGNHSSGSHENSRSTMEAQKHQLMESSVQPMNYKPLIILEKERYTHLAVYDPITRKRPADKEGPPEALVVFMASLEGFVDKYLLHSGLLGACLLERINISCSARLKIKSMQIDFKSESLLIGTSSNFVKLPLHRCSRFKTERTCRASQDPFCSWNQNGCSFSNWSSSSSCPQAQMPVDGVFCNWSPWQPCSQTSSSNSSVKCLCRMRHCSCPKPANEGKVCNGQTIQLKDCSTSFFSSRHLWGPWSPWTSCFGSCNHEKKGLRSRSRICLSNKNRCHGNDLETKECQLVTCFQKKASEWTSWMSLAYPVTKVKVEEKHRCLCSSRLPSNDFYPLLYGENREDKEMKYEENEEEEEEEDELDSDKDVLVDMINADDKAWSRRKRRKRMRKRNKLVPLLEISRRTCLSSGSLINCSYDSDFATIKKAIQLKNNEPNPSYFSSESSIKNKTFSLSHLKSHPRVIISYHHLLIVGFLCFFMGGIVVVVFLIHCRPSLLLFQPPSPAFLPTQKQEILTSYLANGFSSILGSKSLLTSKDPNNNNTHSDNQSQTDDQPITSTHNISTNHCFLSSNHKVYSMCRRKSQAYHSNEMRFCSNQEENEKNKNYFSYKKNNTYNYNNNNNNNDNNNNNISLDINMRNNLIKAKVFKTRVT